MKNHFKITTKEGTTFSIIPPHDENDHSLITVRQGIWNASMLFSPEDVVALALLHRAIGVFLDTYQPGLASPVPENDPMEFDAIKVSFEVDRLWREGNEVHVETE